MRRIGRALAAAIGFVALGGAPAGAQDFPSRNVTIVVGFAPGGFVDILARLIGQKLSQRLGRSVVIENKAGASGNIAHRTVATAEPDGQTLLAASTSLAINERLFKNKGYAAADLVPISISASIPEMLAVNPNRPEKNLQEFVATAKQRGQAITFGSAGIGSGSYIAAEYFFRFVAGIPALHVPYSGGGTAIAAAISNHVDVVAVAMAGAVEPIRAGMLRGLGVAMDKRVRALPDVPTYDENGYAGFTAAAWAGFFAPAKTDPQIVRRLNTLIGEILNEPEILQRLNAIGFEPIHSDQPAAEALFAAEIQKWGRMVESIGAEGK